METISTGDTIVSVAIPHVRQKETWDCGIACVEMILQYAKGKYGDRSNLISTVKTKSIWTIDLAFLLRELDISFRFYTTYCGGLGFQFFSLVNIVLPFHFDCFFNISVENTQKTEILRK